MNLPSFLPRLFLTTVTACVLAFASPMAAQTVEQELQAARATLEADRHTVVTEALRLTDPEARAFWPLYHQYRAAMDKHGKALAKLILEYGDLYPDVPEARAAQMLKELTGVERQLVNTRTSYLKKVGRVLPPGKALRFAQVENRLDLALRLKLAVGIPLVPIEGRLAGEARGAVAVAAGVPGGVVVQTMQLQATVAAVDQPRRRITLVNAEGIKQTVKAGPEVINFDQIRVGDQLQVTVTEQLVVAMAGPGEAANDGPSTVVALAAKGARPGGLLAETVQVTATVTALDAQQRTATLRFEDGSTRTFPVRNDVDLGQRKVGDQVVFRLTEQLAVRIAKP